MSYVQYEIIRDRNIALARKKEIHPCKMWLHMQKDGINLLAPQKTKERCQTMDKKESCYWGLLFERNFRLSSPTPTIQ